MRPMKTRFRNHRQLVLYIDIGFAGLVGWRLKFDSFNVYNNIILIYYKSGYANIAILLQP